MRVPHQIVRLSFNLFLFALASQAQSQNVYESLQDRQANVVLPKEILQSGNYTVGDIVRSDGFLNIYTLDSKFGSIEVTSTFFLLKRIKEIEAMIEMENTSQVVEFAKGIQDSATGMVISAKGLLINPIGTVSGTVSGLHLMFRSTSADVSEGVEYAAEGVTNFALSGNEEDEGGEDDASIEDMTTDTVMSLIGFEDAKRERAFDLGLDYYSRNQTLQENLDRFTQASFAGNKAASFGMGAVPGLSDVMTAFSLIDSAQSFNTTLRDYSASTLSILNRDALVGMGIGEDIVDLFLANQLYTPRERTAIVVALNSMTDVKDRAEFVKFSVLTENVNVALFNHSQAVMYAAIHKKETKLDRFVVFSGRISAALSNNGNFVFCAPLDHLYWTEDLAEFMDNISQEVDTIPEVKNKQLWLTGSVSKLAHQSLQALGWTILENTTDQLSAALQDNE